MTYLDELDRELRAVGIRGGRRRRILAEVEDHLLESRDESAFGSPALVAQQFADELATSSARRLAFGSFLALVPAGLAFVSIFVFGGTGPDITSGRHVAVGVAAAAAIALAPQFSFAGALLAVLRSWRLRGFAAAPAAELRIVRRRTAFALGSGALALVALPTYAYEYSAGLSRTWITAVVASSAAALLPVAVAAAALVHAGRLRPALAGERGDVVDDLEPLRGLLPSKLWTPWRLCLGLAALVALSALVAGGVDDGPRNAIGEAVAICAAFGALGRFLGLRR